ncbi:fucose permease [Herbinix hemicellulosilytica]|uniref:Putative membrane protein n=1 Tax=Herbinix hemicellulosilytica TaxID=1564487 RepID=A0A0H5SF83_HERHM|nr:MFS transporter [Herbinix hemicellulosilytica]RBP57659.1 fucose permease [Herbinix hemicellulosilytica]CRZ34142.1 putative membrane protein [Herbinix hemicellulosilytica]
MYSLLLALIYIAFISLGLPDSLLGSAWPVMYEQLEVPISYAGIVTMIIAGGSVISGILSNRLTKKFGAGVVTVTSVMMTAVALMGFSFSDSYILLCLWALPYGFGAGGVDAALNNYVALHYAARHMSWLHCFWGVGATISPYIMGYSLTKGYGWNNGYRFVGILQLILTAILFTSLPLWKRNNNGDKEDESNSKSLSLIEILNIRGVKLILAAFFAYCSLESTAGLWASSYLANYRGVDPEIAATFASLFYIGITVGRFLTGFIYEKLGDKLLIRYGIGIITAGLIMVLLPLNGNMVALGGIVITGLGCAPIFPAVIHATPSNFGKEHSQSIIGVQMAGAYIGTTFMPMLFGFIADNISIGLYPIYLLVFTLLMALMTEMLNNKLEKEIVKKTL